MQIGRQEEGTQVRSISKASGSKPGYLGWSRGISPWIKSEPSPAIVAFDSSFVAFSVTESVSQQESQADKATEGDAGKPPAYCIIEINRFEGQYGLVLEPYTVTPADLCRKKNIRPVWTVTPSNPGRIRSSAAMIPVLTAERFVGRVTCPLQVTWGAVSGVAHHMEMLEAPCEV